MAGDSSCAAVTLGVPLTNLCMDQQPHSTMEARYPYYQAPDGGVLLLKALAGREHLNTVQCPKLITAADQCFY